MDVSDWLVDDALYRLPDGAIVGATLEERDDAFRWILRDLEGQRLFIFMDDGRVRAYVREYVPARDGTPQDNTCATRISMVPCDLMVEDLQVYIPRRTRQTRSGVPGRDVLRGMGMETTVILLGFGYALFSGTLLRCSVRLRAPVGIGNRSALSHRRSEARPDQAIRRLGSDECAPVQWSASACHSRRTGRS